MAIMMPLVRLLLLVTAVAVVVVVGGVGKRKHHLFHVAQRAAGVRSAAVDPKRVAAARRREAKPASFHAMVTVAAAAVRAVAEAPSVPHGGEHAVAAASVPSRELASRVPHAVAVVEEERGLLVVPVERIREPPVGPAVRRRRMPANTAATAAVTAVAIAVV